LEIKSIGLKKNIETLESKVDIIIFNKPMGFVCSKGDSHNKTIYELLPKEFHNYFYVGRLDKDSR
jgi:16S rRNA U516 pseudouridylate synthase RsuA-like enzyme